MKKYYRAPRHLHTFVCRLPAGLWQLALGAPLTCATGTSSRQCPRLPVDMTDQITGLLSEARKAHPAASESAIIVSALLYASHQHAQMPPVPDADTIAA